MAINKSTPTIKNSVQNNIGSSFDEDFGVLAVELLSHNPISNTLERVSAIQGNPSLTLTYDGSDQLTGIAMTIGANTYNKTLTWAGGVCTAISLWS